MTIDVRTVRYDDYRRAQGLVLPFKITTDHGVDGDADVVQIERIEHTTTTAETFRRPRPPNDFVIAGFQTCGAPTS